MASKGKIFASGLVKAYLEDLAGLNALKVAKALPTTKEKSEYDVAEDIKMNINKLRSILYKFYSKNLVVYSRQRDAKKGWYIYHWKFFPDKLVQQIILDKRKDLRNLESPESTVNGANQVYYCSNCGENYDFTSAFNENFLCPNCSLNLKTLDAKKIVNKSRKEQKQLEKEIEELKKLL